VAGGSTDEMFGRWKNWLNDVSLDPIPGLRVLPRKLTEKRDNTAREERMSGSVPEDARKYIRLGDMLRDAQRPAGAVKEYRKALQRSDKISPDLRVELARVLMRSDQITPAETTLSEVGKYYPDYLPLYLTRARIHRQQGATEAAVEDLRTVIDINPFDPRPHRMLIRIYREKDEEGKLQREQKVLKEIYNWLRE
jgi:tetratricopeptide (TPR) repeat protein